MRELSQKQKKTVIIVVLILVAAHFAPGVVHNMTAFYAARKAPHTPVPGPGLKAMAQVPSTTKLPVPIDVQMRYFGKWEGKGVRADSPNSLCQVSLEIRLDPVQPGSISGYETKNCINVPVFLAAQIHPMSVQEAMRIAAPVSTVMSGSSADGDLQFNIDKTVGTSPAVCPHASYSLSSFGQKSVVAQWRDVDCPAGSMVLTRVGG